MAKTISYETFTGLLPTCNAAQSFPILVKEPDFNYNTIALTEFVPPNLGLREDLGDGANPKVIIISAAGAVGKSTMASEIAMRCNAPLWDLSLAGPVATGSLSGRLSRAYGVGKIAAIDSALVSNSMFLVIDALDEAQIKTSRAGFEAFIKDIAELAKRSTKCNIVLLGRTQISESSWLMLTENGVDAAMYTIEPFTEEQSKQYLDRRTSVLSKQFHVESATLPMVAHREKYCGARDLTWSLVFNATLAAERLPTAS